MLPIFDMISKSLRFNYRNSSFSNDEILIDANFKFIESNKETVSKNKLKASGG